MRSSLLNSHWRKRNKTTEPEKSLSFNERLAKLEKSKPSEILTEAGVTGVEKSSEVFAKPERHPDKEANEGRFIGFWVIPHGEAFVKLKIKSSYKLGHHLGKTVKTKVGSTYYPVWPLLNSKNKKTLVKSGFKFVKGLAVRQDEEAETKTNPLFDLSKEGENARELELQKITSKILSEGWIYVIKEKSSIIIGATGSLDTNPLFSKLLEELFKGRTQAPQSVSLNTKGVKEIKHISSEGELIQTIHTAELQAHKRQSVAMAWIDAVIDEPDRPLAHYQELLATAPRRQKIIGAAVTMNKHKQFLRATKAGLDNFIQATTTPDVDEETRIAAREANKLWMQLTGSYEEFRTQYHRDLSFFSESLVEMTFNRLWGLTRQNGGYAQGGMVKVAGRWVYDPSVPDRMANGARYVVTRPPKVSVASDGNPQILYNFKSKTNRSTTGLRQKGYVKYIYKTNRARSRATGFGKKSRRSEFNLNCHVFCSCPDFKYRWHKVLFDAGASHKPRGGGEAINQFPVKTNPAGKISMCKHLVAAAAYVSMSQRDMAKYFKEIDRIHAAGLNPQPGIDNPPELDDDPNVTPEVEDI